MHNKRSFFAFTFIYLLAFGSTIVWPNLEALRLPFIVLYSIVVALWITLRPEGLTQQRFREVIPNMNLTHATVVAKWQHLLRDPEMDIHTRLLISLFLSDLMALAPAEETS